MLSRSGLKSNVTLRQKKEMCFDSRRRASTMNHSSLDRYPSLRSSSLPATSKMGLKKYSQNFGEETKQLLIGKRKGASVQFDSSDAMAQLEAKLALIRGDLESLQIQGRDMSQRVAVVTAGVQSVSGRHEEATTSEDDCTEETTPRASTSCSLSSSSRLSLEAISESDCEADCVKKFSVTSLHNSNRDSGIDCSDPAFEMMDPGKYCSLNNLSPHCSQHPKKARSTSSLVFIKNNLHDDAADRLKATSYDRLSCFSDSALLTYSIKHSVL